MDQIKVILPNGTACLNLQKILIKKQTITILPNIIPLSNIKVTGKETFRISPENLNPITSLEEKIILTDIIYNYPKSKFNVIQSLQFSPIIAKLFYELIYNDLSIEDINNRIYFNNSEHWKSIYELLQFSYQEWKHRIQQLKKQDKANYQINMLKAEVEKLKSFTILDSTEHNTKNNYNLIVAGIIFIMKQNK
ncbi:unnamed protein product [Oppiella nova]|uniref:Uncharacterized protein n=1 Tax=Oppiella nova TaxID=334625 RepID=A0A7R9LBM4_9ACAR|nr:unnamed protein product [Oppiella nova]CAG2161107.1 unnamed protein product [Oppiella nova]